MGIDSTLISILNNINSEKMKVRGGGGGGGGAGMMTSFLLRGGRLSRDDGQ